MSTSLHFLTLVKLGTLLKSVKLNLLPKYMLDIPLVNSTHFLHMCRCVDWGVRIFQDFFTPVYTQVFGLHQGFLVYTLDFEFTPRFFGLLSGFWVYTQVFWFTPRILSLHPGFWVYTEVFRFTPRILSLHPGFLIYT